MNILSDGCVSYDYVIEVSSTVTKYLLEYNLPLDIIKNILKLVFSKCDYSHTTIEIKATKCILDEMYKKAWFPQNTFTTFQLGVERGSVSPKIKTVLSYEFKLKHNQILSNLYTKGKYLYTSSFLFGDNMYLDQCIEFQEHLRHRGEQLNLYLSMTGQTSNIEKNGVCYSRLHFKEPHDLYNDTKLFSKYKKFNLYVLYLDEIDEIDINDYCLYPKIAEIMHY